MTLSDSSRVEEELQAALKIARDIVDAAEHGRIRRTDPDIVWATSTREIQIARALLTALAEMRRLLVEWRDAREAIFKAEKPSPEAFTRLGAAEVALMSYARAALPEAQNDEPD